MFQFVYKALTYDWCSVAKPHLWVIELHNGQDSRLTEELIDHGLKPALDAVEKHWREQWRAAQNSEGKEGGQGAVIIVGRRDQNKFFSNGESMQNSVGKTRVTMLS